MNGFLAALDNNATPPINPSSTTGNVIWPAPFLVRTYTPAEATLQNQLFGNTPSRLVRFIKAIQLLWVVEESVAVDVIVRTDPAITYTAQLVGQFDSVSLDYCVAATEALAQLPFMNPDVLSVELRSVYNSSITPLDRLAVFVAHFGQKYAS